MNSFSWMLDIVSYTLTALNIVCKESLDGVFGDKLLFVKKESVLLLLMLEPKLVISFCSEVNTELFYFSRKSLLDLCNSASYSY